MPYKCPPAPLEVAFLIEAELRERGLRDKTEHDLPLADQPRVHHRERLRDGHPDLRGEGDQPRAARGRGRDRRRAQGGHHRRVRGAPVRPADLRAAAQGRPGGHRLRPRPEVRLAADRPPDAPGEDRREAGAGPGRRGHPRFPNVYALGDATDLPLSKAGSTAHFEAPIVAERVAAAVQGREPEGKDASYTGKVMCFFEVGDGKGTLLQFDYDHPPQAAQAEPALAPRQDRLQQDLLAHRARRVASSAVGGPGRAVDCAAGPSPYNRGA